jgi:integrase
MGQKLTDKLVKGLERPATGNRIYPDEDVKGFGVRVTAAGAIAFVINYRSAGRERRLTIGSFPDWTVSAARERARELKRRIDVGEDPMAERHRERSAPTVADLAVRYLAEHAPRKRPGSVAGDVSLLDRIILPRLGKLKVEVVRRAEISALHREVTIATPIRANRLLSLLKKMFNLAIVWELRADNPCKGIERNQENRRERYLTPAELVRLTDALAVHRDHASANAIRLLLLTGARRGEALGATWDQFDLEAGVWTKPAATTKQKRVHRVPLSAPALLLLSEMKAKAGTHEIALFPGRGENETQGGLKRSWASICRAADIEGLHVHDLRHSYASFLAGAGMSLPVIGALLGHTQPSTTARYAHLMDDPLRAATERVGAIVTGAGKPSATVVPLRRRT